MPTLTSNPRIPFELSSERKRLAPPEGKGIIVHVAVNLETWPFDQPMPRAILQAPHGQQPKPDIANFSWVEYGLRCGLPRLVRELGARRLAASNIMNARFHEVYPSAARAAAGAGWAIVGHAVVQRSLVLEKDEAATIAEALAILEEVTGRRPRGWLGPGFGETLETPDHLRAAGMEFVLEWMVDDLPAWMRTAHGPMIAMPYGLDLNDVTIFALEKHTAEEYVRRYMDTLAVLERETTENPRVLTLPLHPHIIGVPYRFGAFCRVLDMLQARNDTIFMTADQIADWFKSECSPE
jgi:allantoinase